LDDTLAEAVRTAGSENFSRQAAASFVSETKIKIGVWC
jgi:hypothetical protein